MKSQEMIGKIVIVRCNRAGVFYGTLSEFDSVTREATLTDVRCVWYWNGAASLSQLAAEGVKNKELTKMTQSISEMVVMEVIEIIPCTDDAIKNLNSVKVWKK